MSFFDDDFWDFEFPEDPEDLLEADDQTLGNFFMAAAVVAETCIEGLTRPLESDNNYQSNPKQVAHLISGFRSIEAKLSPLQALLQENFDTIPSQTRDHIRHNIDDIRTVVSSALPELENILAGLSEKDTSEFQYATANFVNRLIKPHKDELHRVTTTFNELHTMVAAACTQPSFPHKREARQIAARVVPPERAVYSVFISHAGEDKDHIAIPLWQKLRARGIKAFVDREDLKPGEDAPANMKDAMASAPVGVFILSPEFAAKKWPMLELMTYLERARAAPRGDGPDLLPLFYRLSLRQCTDSQMFWDSPENEQNPFLKNGFARRAAQGDTGIADILGSFEQLSKRTGIENEDGARNDDTEDMAERRDDLLNRLADGVEQAVLRKRE